MELEQAGIARSRMHTIARDGIDISGLPSASEDQKQDKVWLWDRILWRGSLILFAILLTGLVLSLMSESNTLTVVTMALMAAVFLSGAHFATRVPHVHLNEMQVPLLHGEVVLLVDTPRQRVQEIIRLVSGRHPEVGLGGVGWTLNHAGI